jgi:hypothetical protein
MSSVNYRVVPGALPIKHCRSKEYIHSCMGFRDDIKDRQYYCCKCAARPALSPAANPQGAYCARQKSNSTCSGGACHPQSWVTAGHQAYLSLIKQLIRPGVHTVIHSEAALPPSLAIALQLLIVLMYLKLHLLTMP